MSRSLFEEAIADAKQLREVAEMNAKNAIIEAVTPKIREFIESQLVGGNVSNEDADFVAESLSDSDDEEEVALDESALRSLAELMNGAGNSAPEKKNNDLAALSEAFDSLSEEEQGRLLALIKEDDASDKKSETVETSDAYEINLEELKASIVSEMKSKAQGAKMNNVMDEELYELDDMMGDEDDLKEAILKVVGTPEEKEAFDQLSLSGVEFEEGAEGEEEVEVGEEESEEAIVEPEEEMGAEAEEALAETVYEIDENMLRRELARLREAKARKKGSSEKSHKAAAAAFGGGMIEGDVLDTEINELDLAKKKMMKEARENRALKQQLNDYRGAIETLREQLSDLNLFNAKLLYVNKILQNKDVAPNQRRAIVEALDGATNLREAKLLFESLTSSITSKNETLSESVKHTAGLASRPVTSASARMNGAGEIDRWATLAGLK